MGAAAVEVWAGVECSRVRIGDRTVDQLELTGHVFRPDDLDALAALGVRTVRYPVLWDRVAPARIEDADWSWADARLSRLRDLGMRPVVGLLHHGPGGSGLTYLDDDFPAAFGEYAGAVARRYPWVDRWLPINEPLTTARFAGLYGFWWPHARDPTVFIRILLNQILAVRAAIAAIRAVIPEARFIENEDVGRTSGTRTLRRQIRHERVRRWLTFDLLMGHVDRSHPLWTDLAAVPGAAAALEDLVARPCPPDLLGVDYYVTSDRWLDDRLVTYPASSWGGNGIQDYADVELVRVRGRRYGGISAAIRETWARYRRPIVLSEVHLGAGAEDQVAWWREALGAVERARAAGADVRAITSWAAFGVVDWTSLLREERGEYEPGAFDVRVHPPAITALGRAVMSTNGAVPRSTGRGGWWRRPDRATYGPEASR